MANEEAESEQIVETVHDDVMESGDISILNSLVGHGSPRSLSCGARSGQASGETLLCENMCTQVAIDIQGLLMEVDFYVLLMTGPDLVLGIQWLQKLGKVTHDYSKQTMEFTWSDKGYLLRGDEALRMKRISLHHMRAWLETDDVYGVYELYHMDAETTKQGNLSGNATLPRHPDIEELISRFETLFQVPTTLPPRRSVDHQIHLYPNTKPVNVRPYRYSHYQKGEVEKLVNEMLSQEIIRDHEFYVKKSKCVFGTHSLEYLGHIISGRGVEVDLKKGDRFPRHNDRGHGRGKHKFSQGRNHENFNEERKEGETSHRRYNKNNFKKSSYNTSKLRCYKCKEIGHIAHDCPLRTKPNEQSNLVEKDLEPNLLMAILVGEEQEVLLHEKDVGYKETNMDSLWYSDNGARSSEVNSQVTPNFSTQSYYQSDNESIQIMDSPLHIDHKPVRGFRTLNDNYENTEELLLAKDEPMNYKEASSNQKCIEAMKVELNSINRNNTWELTTLPKGHKRIGLKWIFKTKKDANGNIIKHKARLVAKGYIQQHGIDFEEIFTLVASIEITQTNGDISIKQSTYANKILKEAGMIDYNETWIPMDPGTRLTKITKRTTVNSTEYQSLIGCLRYLLHTRPDLSYSIGLLSRFMQEPRERHMKAIRQVLPYVKGIKDYGITYKRNGGIKIHGCSDNSYRVNTQEGKGTTGIIFYYGESLISWSTQKQATVALSSCESEFIAITAATT
nr:ribonuclease H-like domain, reverse transcriptase, RNA-dependent DNA polymerase [Tanacetum cinerariifolium]